MPTQDIAQASLSFPVLFPVKFSNATGLSLPLKFPVTFKSSMRQSGLRFPIAFPMKFEYAGDLERTTVKIPIRCTTYTGVYSGKILMPCYETAKGKIKNIPFTEKAWWFPGLILDENIIAVKNSTLALTENVQSLIIADFELESTNRVKVKWSGSTVPSLSIMKKSDSDDNYINAGTFGWGIGEAVVDIASEDYNIYLLGTSNSGSSAIYTIGGANDALVVPDIEVTLNEKIYDLEIDNTSQYHITINY